LRFDGEDTEFNLAAHEQIEFDSWRWADMDDALDCVAEFKRETYGRVIEMFRPLINTVDLAPTVDPRAA
jgi:putative (di)nucleoside polyphosphate hydrolase